MSATSNDEGGVIPPRSIDRDTATPFLSALALWAKAGWSPVPAQPETKLIAVSGVSGRNGKRADADLLKQWAKDFPRHSIAVVMPANVIGIDVDHGYEKTDADGVTRMKQGGFTLSTLEDMLGPLPETVRSSSRVGNAESGIRFYRLPGELPDGTLVNSDDFPKELELPLSQEEIEYQRETGKKLQRHGDVDIIRRAHRYAIVAPSRHVETGQRYRLWDEETGESLDLPPHVNDLPMLPDSWVRYLIEASKPKREVPERNDRPAPALQDEKPSDYLERAVSWYSLLTGRFGPSSISPDRCWSEVTPGYYARPGKDPKHGHTAAVEEGDRRVRIHGTPDSGLQPYFDAGLPGDDCLVCSKLDVLCVMHFDSDRSAASKWISDTYMRKTSESDDSLAARLKADKIAAKVNTEFVEPKRYSPATVWADPTSLDIGSERDLPVWPIQILPDALRRRIEEFSAGEHPIDLLATFGFGAHAAALTGVVKVDNGSYTGFPNLYLIASAPPSMGKTPSRRAMAGLLDVIQQENRDSWREASISSSAEFTTARLARERMERQLGGFISAPIAGDPDAGPSAGLTLAELMQVEETARNKLIPEPVMLAEDASPEALAQYMGAYLGRVFLLSDEPSALDTITGKSYGGGGVNTTIYLKGDSGEMMRRTRIGDTRGGEPSHLEVNAHVSIVLGTQPAPLENFLHREDLGERGLVARFNLTHIIDVSGYRDLDKADPKIALTDFEKWSREFLESWMGQEAGKEDIHTVTFTPDARALGIEFIKHVELECRPGGSYSWDKAWARKLSGNSMWKFAAVLALMHRHVGPVTLNFVRDAIILCDYYTAHTSYIRRPRKIDELTALQDVARQVLLWFNGQCALAKIQPTENGTWLISTAKAEHCPVKAQAPEIFTAALNLLEERGWIRQWIMDRHPEDDRVSPRQTPLIELHPQLADVRKGLVWTRPSLHQLWGSEDWSVRRLAGAADSKISAWLEDAIGRVAVNVQPDWMSGLLAMANSKPEPEPIDEPECQVESDTEEIPDLSILEVLKGLV
jgi:replicative DNA helicase